MALRSMTMLGGRYRLTERIAAGGMGEVWRADDTVLGRAVAVKVLKAEYADSPEFRTRFRREARLAAALSHAGVAQVYDSGDGEGDQQPYLVMELVDGEPLGAVLARVGRLDARRTAHVVAQAAAALGAAHRAGLVHRDVKPGNLLISGDGTVKITDFGIARAVDAAPLTQADTVVGTPLYLSPEQAAGRPATATSDLYSLGIVAYECLTGEPPFQGDPVAVTLAHRDQPLPRTITGPLGDLITALTAKDPAQRPTAATDVAAWAQRIARDDSGAATRVGMPVPVAPAAAGGSAPPDGYGYDTDYDYDDRPRSRRGLLLGTGAAVLAVTAGGLGWALRGTPAASEQGPPADASTEPDQPQEAAGGRQRRRLVRVDAGRYRGRPVVPVVAELRQLGLRTEVRRERAGRRPGTVIRVGPTGEVPVGSLVTVVVAVRDGGKGRKGDRRDEDQDGDNSGPGNGDGDGKGGKGKG